MKLILQKLQLHLQKFLKYSKNWEVKEKDGLEV